MAIQLQHLRLRVQTDDGIYGTDIDLRGSLVIVQAENTSGKSTCAMSILYALGLEGMLGPSHLPPLPEVVRERLLTAEHKPVAVHRSSVRLQLANEKQEVITISRLITGSGLDRQRVEVTFGGVEVTPTKDNTRDFFVRTARSAQSALGFHAFLAEYLGMTIPQLRRFDGEEIPLYLECLAPFFFVDQISGWRDIKARMPTYLQIPDMSQRAIEFILKLDILHRALRREQLEREEASLKAEWTSAIAHAQSKMPHIGIVVRNLPDSPPNEPFENLPYVLLFDNDEWMRLEDAHSFFGERRDELESREIPQAAQVSREALERIVALEHQREQVEHELSRLELAVSADLAQLESIETRVQSLRENLRQYEDEKRLRDRGGSSLRALNLNQHCPTCGSLVKDALVEQLSAIKPMSLEDNIIYLRDQIGTFRTMRSEVRRTIEGTTQRAVATRARLAEIIESIRAVREVQRTRGDAPSVAAVRERLQIESKLDAIGTAKTIFEQLVTDLKRLAERYAKVAGDLKLLSGNNLSDSDKMKLLKVSTSYREQLAEYGFSSYPVEELSVSLETYRPARLQFDLGLTSASDSIRSIWAYLLSLLEVAVGGDSNHLGFLLLDEPQQQMVKQVSHEALLRRAAKVAELGAQILVFTSHDREALARATEGIQAERVLLDKWIIRKIDTDGENHSTGTGA